MLKVLLVDDEPVISQGLMALLDWEAEGCEIVKTACNGQEALDYLAEQNVDLIFVDIKMPVMDGLELLRHLYEEKLTQASCIIMSGFNDFSYAQTALRYGCMDYLLKPVQKEELLAVLRRSNTISEKARKEKEAREHMEADYLRKSMNSLLVGSISEQDVTYMEHQLRLTGEVCYVSIVLQSGDEEDTAESEIESRYRRLYETCCTYLQEDASVCMDMIAHEEGESEVGLLLAQSVLARAKQTREEFLIRMQQHLAAIMETEVTFFVGKTVASLARISQSYGSVHMLKPLESFQSSKAIYYYEKEMQVRQGGVMICKDQLDQLLTHIEQNHIPEIKKAVRSLFEEMDRHGMTTDMIRLNTNYLLFSLIHLATEQDGEVNQDKILHYISDNSYTDKAMRGSSLHLQRFCCDYAEYLNQLRKENSGDVLQDMEKEIRQNFRENLTLKELGRKFYLNSSYLGQLFRKKYQMSFKDYLNQYRVNEAAKLLSTTDKKISDIAELVGYRDPDYFIRKFIELKGCTPTKYRNNSKS